jgi:hypothetical protein
MDRENHNQSIDTSVPLSNDNQPNKTK